MLSMGVAPLAALGRRLFLFPRAPGDVDRDTPEAMQAPALFVLAAAALELAPTTAPAADPPTKSQAVLVCIYFFLWCVVTLVWCWFWVWVRGFV